LAPRQLGPPFLALFLFLASILTGRVLASNPIAVHPASSPPPSTLSPTPVAPAAASPSPSPTATPTPLPPTPTIQASGTVVLDAENSTVYHLDAGCLRFPLRLVVLGGNAYVLDTGQLKRVALGTAPSCQVIQPPGNEVDGVPVQELGDITLSEEDRSLLLLDRAGNVFRYTPEDNAWRVERLANSPGASSSQYLLTISAAEDGFYLLDTNLGQIWHQQQGQAQTLDASLDLRESADLAVGQGMFVLAEDGYRGPLHLYRLSGEPLAPDPEFEPPPDLTRPALLFLDREPGGLLYVLDQDHQCVSMLDPASGSLVREYVLGAEEAEIHALYAEQQKLYLASGDAIYVYPREPTGSPEETTTTEPPVSLASLPPHDVRVLELLPHLALPIEDTMLSNLSFRLPGAPRPYRYGVHEGIDFYWAAGEAVTTTTPVLSVAAGEIVRIDVDYSPPSAGQMESMLAHAAEVFHTPAETLDVLRGRQVWIDHGEGVVSRYCHLSAVAEDLTEGDQVEQGQVVGYVGNSGTPASYYGQGLEMHLHLEIRIGEGYLGQYLRSLEVKQWLDRAFGVGA
jgi:murein DD-endopeptidase MepM/ murein hydrolase activator NlpD